MDVLSQMNAAIQYIEDNLTEPIDLKEVARHAYYSEFHFKRMFSFLAGVPLSEYIRRRRLTLAAFEFQQHNVKVIDVAMKYGYSSPDAFTKAFQKLHQMSPSDARRRGHSFKAFPRMAFQLTIQGGNEMHYRIVEKAPFHIVGMMKRVPIIFEGVNPHISAMWEALDQEKIKALKALSDTAPRGIIQASTHFSEERMEEKGELDHYIGVATTKGCPVEFACLQVPELTWAVFEVVGPFPQTLQKTWGRIYSEWFPTSSFEQVQGPEILWNESPDTSKPDYKSEIWIPVQPSQTR